MPTTPQNILAALDYIQKQPGGSSNYGCQEGGENFGAAGKQASGVAPQEDGGAAGQLGQSGAHGQ